MMIEAIPALADNYIWALRAGSHCAVVDPGEAAPVKRYLEDNGLALCAILITHRHRDHTGGVVELIAQHRVPVYGPAKEASDVVTHPCREGETVRLAALDEEWTVLELPGHTRGHIAYYRPGALFSGDVLFGAGCGKIFEGTFAEMFASLQRLAALPATTQIYCAHEYTASCLRFAAAVEPDNADIVRRAERVAALRAHGKPSVPLLLAEELATNPHLRWSSPAVIEAAARWLGRPPADALDTFTAIRQWRDIW